MKQSRSLWLLVACIAILMSDVFFAGVALAALPPLSDEDSVRRQMLCSPERSV